MVRQRDELARHPYLPLEGLDGAEIRLGLPPLGSCISQALPDTAQPFPSKLAEISAESLCLMRRALERQGEAALLYDTSERLLRYAETRFPNVAALHSSLQEKALAAQLLGAYFLDYHSQTGDLRFLNAAIKLLEGRGYRSALRAKCIRGRDLVWVLWCRNAILAESALLSLSHERE